MMALWTAFKSSKLVVYGTMAFAGLLAFVGYSRMKVREGERKAERKAQEKTVENVQKADKAEKRVAAADPDERDKLRDKWTR